MDFGNGSQITLGIQEKKIDIKSLLFNRKSLESLSLAGFGKDSTKSRFV